VAQGLVIFYRASAVFDPASRIDRHNIRLLKRVVQKSTTAISLEILYHEPLRLSDWAEPLHNVRYVRLRSGEDYPLAERIANTDAAAVVFFDTSLLLHHDDVWFLLGRRMRSPFSALAPRRALRRPGERSWSFYLREARCSLTHYLYPQSIFAARAFAIQKPLLLSHFVIKAGSFHERVAWLDIVKAQDRVAPSVHRARSADTSAPERLMLLETLHHTVTALATWRASKKFPYWFNGRSFLFHIAQLAIYFGALVAMVSFHHGLLLMGFAAILVPRYTFANMHWRRVLKIPAQFGARLLLLFFG